MFQIVWRMSQHTLIPQCRLRFRNREVPQESVTCRLAQQLAATSIAQQFNNGSGKIVRLGPYNDVPAIRYRQTIHQFRRSHHGFPVRHRLNQFQWHSAADEHRQRQHSAILHKSARVPDSPQYLHARHSPQLSRNIIRHVRARQTQHGVWPRRKHVRKHFLHQKLRRLQIGCV